MNGLEEIMLRIKALTVWGLAKTTLNVNGLYAQWDYEKKKKELQNRVRIKFE